MFDYKENLYVVRLLCSVPKTTCCFTENIVTDVLKATRKWLTIVLKRFISSCHVTQTFTSNLKLRLPVLLQQVNEFKRHNEKRAFRCVNKGTLQQSESLCGSQISDFHSFL